MDDNQLFYIGVKGLIRNSEGEYLLLLADVTTHKKNIDPYLDIPGGRIQEGDTIMETLSREILEETGIVSFTNPEHLTTLISNHKIPYAADKEAGLALIIFSVDVPNESKVILNDENTECGWYGLEETRIKLSHKYPKEFIEQLK